jgi:oligopeptide/dipeptide ABC transporter ATP-binding protein
MISQPRILICDEPVSALDVSVRAQIINLLKILQQQLNLTLVFIAHDLSLVRYISDEVLVLYQGKLMEAGATEDVFRYPQHPYTYSLINAEPKPDPLLEKERLNRELEQVRVDMAIGNDLKQGCAYAPRCQFVQKSCVEQEPPLQENNLLRKVACFFPLEHTTTV